MSVIVNFCNIIIDINETTGYYIFRLCDKCALESGSIFKHLTSEEVDMINFEKDFRQYKRGDVLYQEGNRISGFYCINSGIIKVFKTGFDGKEQIIRFAKPGDIIAYRSVLSNEACLYFGQSD
ncbi:MAG: Crp/Fnr family transcriptional regulator [Sphingobacterium sp.]|nr:Crp/Fnr family transcriptional regulator [Sphingobacterium sp.]